MTIRKYRFFSTILITYSLVRRHQRWLLHEKKATNPIFIGAKVIGQQAPMAVASITLHREHAPTKRD